MTDNSKFELKFFGGDITPEKVSARDLADVIVSFETLLLSRVIEDYPSISEEDQLISLVSLTKGSICLQYEVHNPSLIVPSTEETFSYLRDSNFQDFPTKGLDALRRVTLFSKKYSCNAQFSKINGNKEVLAEITKDFQITPPIVEIKGITTVYGVIFSVGGKEPNVHIELPDGRTLICKLTKDQAISLASKLYSWAGFRGKAKFNLQSREYCSFQVEEIIDFQPGKSSESMDLLSRKYGKYFNKIGDVEKFVNDSRESDGEDE